MYTTSKELIDAIAPNHSRTSCSDENLSNAPSGEYGGRCFRCSLLFVQKNGVEALSPELREEMDGWFPKISG